ncbi:enhanced entry protein [Rhizobium rhizosphaerae]|uniref:Enhanced entry protein n=1 Tax=Xaviernesmea rhizosphaerae TaxID=1672749 RepID=A0A1Q9AF34_9HYPH|nr:tetratricopeptide repeat protein [Xaviernesmea rhizosphaerae]OLP53583.1 enhanced entry protein [Xaviernesmea rhizosphaerae]
MIPTAPSFRLPALLACLLTLASPAALRAQAIDLPGVTLEGQSSPPAAAPEAAAGAQAGHADESFAGRVEQGTGPTGKRGRITPFNGAALPAEDLPRLGSSATPPPAPGAIAPSGGVNVLDRMGASLPALPKEKPFKGKPDEAYGAFQRGYYLTAMELALPRAQKGDAAAQTLVAEIFANGLGVARNTKNAAFWYEQAANAGDPVAMFKFALMLMEGRDVPRDRKRADALMRDAADMGNASAQFNYAQTLVADTPGEKGLKAALPYYEKSAEKGIADAQYALAQIYMNVEGISDDKRATARAWLLRAAASGFDTAQLDAGIWLVDGIGGDRNLEQGFRWMREAAIGGNVIAQNRLAHLYINAIGTRPDPVEAGKWALLSLKAGLSDPTLDDFMEGLPDDQVAQARKAASLFRPQ